MKKAIQAILIAITMPMCAPLQAAEFTLLIHETPIELAKRTRSADAPEYWERYNQFAKALVDAGAMRGGSALSQADTLTVRGAVGNGRGASAARLSGYFVIDVANLVEAKKWAERAPASAAAIEILAHRPNPTMSAPPAMSKK